MGKILSERLAGPDDPIYSEPARSYAPHWSRKRVMSDIERECRGLWLTAIALNQPEPPPGAGP